MTTVKDFYPTYPVTGEQMKDINALIARLDEVEVDLEKRESSHSWGQGFRAVIAGPIPIRTDAHTLPEGRDELLGWLVLQETGWAFTQTPPEMWLKALSQDTSLDLR